jgi:hypothetical protein
VSQAVDRRRHQIAAKSLLWSRFGCNLMSSVVPAVDLHDAGLRSSKSSFCLHVPTTQVNLTQSRGWSRIERRVSWEIRFRRRLCRLFPGKVRRRSAFVWVWLSKAGSVEQEAQKITINQFQLKQLKEKHLLLLASGVVLYYFHIGVVLLFIILLFCQSQ